MFVLCEPDVQSDRQMTENLIKTIIYGRVEQERQSLKVVGVRWRLGLQ